MRCSLRRHVPSDLFPPTSFPDFSKSATSWGGGVKSSTHEPFVGILNVYAIIESNHIYKQLHTTTLVTFKPAANYIYSAVAEDHYGVDELISHTDVDRCRETQCAPHVSIVMLV